MASELSLKRNPLRSNQTQTSLQIRPDGPVEVAARQMVPAMFSWMSGVFALHYVALPLMLGGLMTQSVSSLIAFNTPGFVGATLVFAVLAALIKPKLDLRTTTKRDPVLSAVAGGLVAWALIQNVVPGFASFEAMGTAGAALNIGLNSLEFFLIGMVLASFSRSKISAFSLAAAFQFLQAGISMAIFI